MKNLISLLVLIVVVTSLGSCYYENECITGTPGNTFDNSEIRGETETPSNLTTQSQEPLQTQGNYQDAFYNFVI